MNKIKILFIHHGYGIGGAPINLLNIIKELDFKYYEPVVLLLQESEVRRIFEEEKINVISTKLYFYRFFYKYYCHSIPSYIKWYQLITLFYISFIWLLSKYFFTYKVLKDFKPDIIHLNSSVLTDWLFESQKIAKTIIHLDYILCLF